MIPQVRAVAAILASACSLVLGFAAQRTIGNFIAGLLIAFTQPMRLGDEVEIERPGSASSHGDRAHIRHVAAAPDTCAADPRAARSRGRVADLAEPRE